MSNTGQPIKYHFREEKREAMRAAWGKYNEGHREDRSEANREYIKRPLVKAHILEMKKIRRALLPEGPVAVVVPGAFRLVRPRSPLEKRSEAPECLPKPDDWRVLHASEQCQLTTH